METKERIRKQMLAMRDSLTEEYRSRASRMIAKRVLQRPEYERAKRVLLYVNMRSEVETEGLIKRMLSDQREVYCPKVIGREMAFYKISGLSELSKGSMGILEPQELPGSRFSQREGDEETAWMLVPGCAFDRQYNRIGYGGGYYDRFLEKHQNILTAGLFFSVQEVEDIPAEAFDRRLDLILTEKEGL